MPARRWARAPALLLLLVVPTAITGTMLSGLAGDYRQLRTAPAVQVTVTWCGNVTGTHDIACIGTWRSPAGGPVSGGSGGPVTQTVTGPVHGAAAADVGRALPARELDGNAHLESVLRVRLGTLVVFVLAALAAVTVLARRVWRKWRDGPA